jgi:Fe-S cluster assembly protein SufD
MQQYIDFFTSHRQVIDKPCSPLLNAYRDKAFEDFCQNGFPNNQQENYQQTDIAHLLDADYGFYLDYKGAPFDPYKVYYCNVPHLDAYKYFVINGHFYEEESKNNLPEGVFAGSLNRFATQYPDLFSKYYNQRAEKSSDGLAAFNTSFVQDGYVLYVPENVVIEKTIQLTNVASGNINSLINRRILIILESGAQAKFLTCDHTSDETPTLVSTQVVEIFAGESSVFDFYELEESSLNTIRLTHNFVQQSAFSQVVAHTIALSSGITRNNYWIDLVGKHAETNLYGMVIADGQQKVDNFTHINHLVPECQCNELFKYILDDEAVGTFSGRIVVAPDAQKTEAYQNNRNLLVSSNCRIYSKPQLEIYADDVKCSHGMTTGQLDETALFYMRSRGIPEDEARYLLKLAFAIDILNCIRVKGLKERLRLLVEKRFKGELLLCRECMI